MRPFQDCTERPAAAVVGSNGLTSFSFSHAVWVKGLIQLRKCVMYVLYNYIYMCV